MSEYWADRQRQTNNLVRVIANYLFKQRNVSASQLYGLSVLSWITDSYADGNKSYIKSCKIPALERIFNRSFQSLSLENISYEIADIVGEKGLINLIQIDTGFTNFYKAYRRSSLDWVESNFKVLLPMYKASFNAKSDEDRVKFLQKINSLPGIPIANNLNIRMKPENFLTPTFFTLDYEIKFPIINGNKGVKNLKKALKIDGNDLVTQFLSLVSLYGKHGIEDAADLDQVGLDLPNFISTDKNFASKQLLQRKSTKVEGKYLPLKDESDVEIVRQAGTIKHRKIHNVLTNKLRDALKRYTLYEGGEFFCKYDVLVKNFKRDMDLLIEVKSSTEVANVRMAVGQLFSYCYELNTNKTTKLAILLPRRPNEECVLFLKWMKIGLIWFEEDRLMTEDDWLDQVTLPDNIISNSL